MFTTNIFINNKHIVSVAGDLVCLGEWAEQIGDDFDLRSIQEISIEDIYENEHVEKDVKITAIECFKM